MPTNLGTDELVALGAHDLPSIPLDFVARLTVREPKPRDNLTRSLEVDATNIEDVAQGVPRDFLWS